MSTQTTPVEVTTKYATSVPTLPEAWAFVMARIDQVGDSPSVRINPIWRYSDDEDGTRVFEVVVEGMVEEKMS